MSSGRILIVDDDPDIAGAMGDRLDAAGYEVRMAPGAPDCFEAVRAFEPDLVVLDALMPGVPGLEVLARLRRTRPDLPVLVTSAAVRTGTEAEVRGLGAAGFLPKPYEGRELLSRVEEALTRAGV